MSTKRNDEESSDFKQNEDVQLRYAIGKNVVHSLGQPGDLHGVQVRKLWANHYRVNILVGENAASAKVAHSYFLMSDSDGNVVESTPAITRLY